MATPPKVKVPFIPARFGYRKKYGMADHTAYRKARVHLDPGAPRDAKCLMVSDVPPNEVIEHSGVEFLEATYFHPESPRGRIHGERSEIPPRAPLFPVKYVPRSTLAPGESGFFWESDSGDLHPILRRPTSPITVVVMGSTVWIPRPI